MRIAEAADRLRLRPSHVQRTRGRSDRPSPRPAGQPLLGPARDPRVPGGRSPTPFGSPPASWCSATTTRSRSRSGTGRSTRSRPVVWCSASASVRSRRSSTCSAPRSTTGVTTPTTPSVPSGRRCRPPVPPTAARTTSFGDVVLDPHALQAHVPIWVGGRTAPVPATGRRARRRLVPLRADADEMRVDARPRRRHRGLGRARRAARAGAPVDPRLRPDRRPPVAPSRWRGISPMPAPPC